MSAAREELLAHWRLRGASALGREVRALGQVWLHGEGAVELGDAVVLDGRELPIELHAGPGALLRIGDGARLEGGCSIEALARVEIGPRCHLGRLVKVLDNPFHPLGGDRSAPPPSLPVVLEADTTVGDRAILLPGAHPRAGAHIPAGAIVSRCGKASAPVPVIRGPRPGGARALLRRAERGLGLARARLALRGCELGSHVYVGGPVVLRNRGHIRLGDRVNLFGGPLPTTLRCEPGAELSIGADTLINYGALLGAHRGLRIGRGCLIASQVCLDDAAGGAPAPIELGDRVWLAHGATVRPGVRVGEGAVVGAGAVLTRDLPPGMLAMGSPARFLPIAELQRTA